MCVFAYAISLMVYQIGMLIANGVFGIGTVTAFLVLGVMLFLLLRPNPNEKRKKSL
jgi:ferrous iron transport protein B